MLPKRERLAREQEIKGVIKAKQYESKGPLLYFVARDNSQQFSRLTVVTPKTLGKAVKRNRLRRQVFEVFGKIKPKISKNVDLVVFPKQTALGQSPMALLLGFMSGLKEQGLC